MLGDNVNSLAQPLELPCGVVLKNRVIKSAMSDSLGNGSGDATLEQAKLYGRWANGGTSLSIIGEVQIDPNFPEKPGNLVLGPDANMNLLRNLAECGSQNGTHIWPQLGHAGALSFLPVSNPQGPSELKLADLSCSALSVNEINQLPKKYANAAIIAKRAGFTGVQIHAGHGFLLSQFLSPLFNKRTDEFGGVIENRFSIILKIIHEIRSKVGSSFPIGIKINSSDQLVGGLTNDEALEVVRLLNNTSIDLIEVSGGTYFPGAKSSSDGKNSNGPYFLNFAKTAKSVTNVPIVATGGFKSFKECSSAVSSNSVDAVGLARAMAMEPSLPNIWMGQNPIDPIFPVFTESFPGGVTAWYSMLLTAIAKEEENRFDLNLQNAAKTYDDRDYLRIELWLNKFPIDKSYDNPAQQ